MKHISLSVVVALAAYVVSAAVPVVTVSPLAKDAAGNVTVSYSVDSAAVVTYAFTLDGEPLPGTTVAKVSGGISVPVEANVATSFTWLASLDMPNVVIDSARLGVTLTAYPVSDPPPYAVVNLCTNAVPVVKYYSAESELPGGLHGNPVYKTTKMVLKRVYAKDVEWLMGTTAQNGRTTTTAAETAHFVKMDHDYYLGVFELTKGQYSVMCNGYAHSGIIEPNVADWLYRPVENVPFSEFRGLGATPISGAQLGKACVATGLSFDLPSESEWEFAAKAGHDENHHPDGSPYANNSTNEYILAQANIYTNIMMNVGSLKPNSWGFYDMLGNVTEFCIDFYQENIFGNHDGTPNVSTTDPTKCRDNVTTVSSRVYRGGYYTVENKSARPAYRASGSQTSYLSVAGYRLRLPCPIE